MRSRFKQRQYDSVGQQEAGRRVVNCDADAHRSLARVTGDRHQSAHALGDLVNAGPPGIRPVLAKSGYAAIDDARIDLLHRFVIDAEPMLNVGFVILDDDIGPLGQLEKDLQTFLALQVQRHRPLVAVKVLKIGAIAAAAGRVDLLTGRLDLHHLRPPIGKLANRRRSSPMGGQVDNKEIIQRKRKRRHRLSLSVVGVKGGGKEERLRRYWPGP